MKIVPVLLNRYPGGPGPILVAEANAPTAQQLSDTILNSAAWSEVYSEGAWTATFYQALPSLPSVLALLSFGGLLMVVRRRFAKSEAMS